MRRLVYAPKVFAFIRSRNMDGQIIDVSNDIIDGSVERRVNDISNASLTLRNSKFKYTRIEDGGLPMFLPMDLITIWLQRIAGQPIQVFTGYLDTSPYKQIYPGNCNVTASCTLKRLKHSYFDPGLKFFRDWVADAGEGSWQLLPDGTLFNPTAGVGQPTTVPGETATGETQPISDGGFGRLLLKFMTDIAGWPRQQVLVSNLDPSIAKRAASLFREVVIDAEADFAALEAFLANSMGVTVDAPQSDGVMADGTLPSHLQARVNVIKEFSGNIPPIAMVCAALLRSGMDPSYAQEDGLGLFKLDRNRQYEGQKYTPAQLTTASVAVKLYARLMEAEISNIASQGGELQAVRASAEVKAIRKRLGTTDPAQLAVIMNRIHGGEQIGPAKLQESMSRAQRYMLSLSDPTAAADMKPAQVAMRKMTWADDEFREVLSSRERGVADRYMAKKSYDQLASVTYFLKKIFANKLSLAQSDKQNLDSVYFMSNEAPVKVAPGIPEKYLSLLYGGDSGAAVTMSISPGLLSSYLSFIGRTEVASVTLFHQGRVFGRIEDGVIKREGNFKAADSALGGQSCLRVVVKPDMVIPESWGVPAIATYSDPNSPDSAIDDALADDNPVGRTFSNLATMQANSAFLASISFPFNYIESQMLTGEKSLMNDISCFDAVGQFCAASMRDFMSLPDGRFCAFYPDYFGSQRKPYWPLYDIEIENFEIQLNDHNLRTHSFVVGDAYGGLTGNGIDFMDNIVSRGVASVTMAGIVDSFVSDSFLNSTVKAPTQEVQSLLDSKDFLNHFGARPQREEQPLIRRPDFEFLLAYQRFMQYWASQFATEIDLSYQPEVMAGGIVWLPQHGIQAFVDSVSHTFSYESGFDTSAVFSAPAIANVDGWRDAVGGQYPGFAIGGRTKTVGA